MQMLPKTPVASPNIIPIDVEQGDYNPFSDDDLNLDMYSVHEKEDDIDLGDFTFELRMAMYHFPKPVLELIKPRFNALLFALPD